MLKGDRGDGPGWHRRHGTNTLSRFPPILRRRMVSCDERAAFRPSCACWIPCPQRSYQGAAICNGLWLFDHGIVFNLEARTRCEIDITDGIGGRDRSAEGSRSAKDE